MIYLLFLFALLQTPNCGCEDKPQINVLAVVNGLKITKQDLSIDTRTKVSIAQDTVIAARKQAVAQLINKTLLEAEARKRGITTAKLLELEVSATIVQPTKDEARAFYDRNESRIAQDFKHVKDDIIAQLKTERETVRATQFVNTLQAGAQITVSEQPVTPPATEADLARVFATVDGVSITSRDVENGLLPLIFSVQKQVYALRKQDLDVRINDLLLDQEAKRLGTTPQALIRQNLRSAGSIVSDKEAREFHKQHKELLPGDFDDNRMQILQLMLALQLRKQVLEYAEQLRKGAAVQIYLTEPESPNLEQLCCNPVD